MFLFALWNVRFRIHIYKHCRRIPHFAMSNNLMYSIIDYCSLELVDNLSDHLPIQLCLANHTNGVLAENNCVSENRSARVKKPK